MINKSSQSTLSVALAVISVLRGGLFLMFFSPKTSRIHLIFDQFQSPPDSGHSNTDPHTGYKNLAKKPPP